MSWTFLLLLTAIQNKFLKILSQKINNTTTSTSVRCHERHYLVSPLLFTPSEPKCHARRGCRLSSCGLSLLQQEFITFNRLFQHDIIPTRKCVHRVDQCQHALIDCARDLSRHRRLEDTYELIRSLLVSSLTFHLAPRPEYTLMMGFSKAGMVSTRHSVY